MDRRTLDYYAGHAAELAKGYETRRSAAELFPGCIPDGGRVVDLGAGPGHHLARLREQGYDAWGVEPVEAFRAVAWDLHPEAALYIVPGHLPDGLPPLDTVGGPFHAACARAVLMHLPRAELPAALEAVRGLLLPGGSFVFTVPLERPGIDAESRDAAGRLFTPLAPSELDDLVAAAGFAPAGRVEYDDPLGRAGHRWQGVHARVAGRP